MKATLTAKALVAAALIATAGCAKKRPEQLPPAPGGTETGAVDPDAGSGVGAGVGGEVLPGSQADFVRSVVSDTVYFGLDQYDVDAEDRATLDSQLSWLRRYPNVRVTIEGHADERGTREYNIALGDRRANAAKNYLVAQGIGPDRISTISYGKERPRALGSDDSAWAQNRRAVTVTVGG